MDSSECVAIIFAGERGDELGALTDGVTKSAVLYGGSYRIIDFALSNCRNSGINTVGVLTRRVNDGLYSHIGDGRAWGLSGHGKGVFMLPAGDEDYKGVTDAVYRNVDFVERFSPRYVCVLSCSRIYNMDYSRMLDWHKSKNADVTTAYVVETGSGSNCGLLYPDETGLVLDFEEKTTAGGSNFASIGACIFNWETLRRYLTPEFVCKRSAACFGRDLFPAILSSDRDTMYAYRFDGYWRSVDTLENLWESNMDLLSNPPGFLVEEEGRKVYTSHTSAGEALSYCSEVSGEVNRSILSGSGVILVKVFHSVLSDSVFVGEGAEVVDSIVMPNVYIGKNAKIYKAIVGARAYIMDGAEIGVENGMSAFVSDKFCKNGVSLIAPWTKVGAKTKLQRNSYIALPSAYL